MTILDIFSWVSAKEMSLEEIESLVLSLYEGSGHYDEYELRMEQPIGANEYVAGVTTDLINEGKEVCYLLRDGEVISAIGFYL